MAQEPEGLSPHSQQLATVPSSEPLESNPPPQPVSLRTILFPSSHLRLGLRSLFQIHEDFCFVECSAVWACTYWLTIKRILTVIIMRIMMEQWVQSVSTGLKSATSQKKPVFMTTSGVTYSKINESTFLTACLYRVSSSANTTMCDLLGGSWGPLLWPRGSLFVRTIDFTFPEWSKFRLDGVLRVSMSAWQPRC
jgi:hypothetical protein